MADYSPLLQVMKQSAKETGDATKPVQVCFGKVVSESPLKIQIDQKITLGKAQLVLTKTAANLDTGEQVLLLRQQGGRKYIVVDRLEVT